ncbi:MAG: hypothetical protein ACFFDN_45505 [Candidatus Hodarchaeota archaeon]
MKQILLKIYIICILIVTLLLNAYSRESYGEKIHKYFNVIAVEEYESLSNKSNIVYIYDPGHPESCETGLLKGYYFRYKISLKEIVSDIVRAEQNNELKNKEKSNIIKIAGDYQDGLKRRLQVIHDNILQSRVEYETINNIYRKKYSYYLNKTLVIKDAKNSNYPVSRIKGGKKIRGIQGRWYVDLKSFLSAKTLDDLKK